MTVNEASELRGWIATVCVTMFALAFIWLVKISTTDCGRRECRECRTDIDDHEN